MVVDAMNFRVQALDRSGQFQYAIGKVGDGTGAMFRPKGIGVDSEDHLYVVDGFYGIVQVFDGEGQLLYYFGQKGNRFWGIWATHGIIHRQDGPGLRCQFLPNARVQVFQYYAVKQAKGGLQ